MSKQIHIHAKCPAFEIFEIVPEGKAVARLVDIRDGFTKSIDRVENIFDGSLVVKIVVVNPKLPFKNL